MQLATFTPGSEVQLCGEPYSIVAWEPDTKIFSLAAENGTRREFEFTVLLDQYQLGNLRPVVEGRTFREASSARTTSRKRLQQELLVDLPDETIREIEFRVKLLRWLESNGIALSCRFEFAEVQVRFREEVGLAADAWVPSLSTVKRWRVSYCAGHRDAASLTPHYRNRGGAGISRLNQELDDLVSRCIDNYFLTSEQQSALSVYKILEGDVAALNKRRSEINRLSCPGYSTFLRRIKGRSAYSVYASRFGTRAADFRFSSATRGTSKRFGFMEQWEMDHASLAVIVIDPDTGLALGRPRLTLVMETSTKMVCGFTIGLDGMSAIASLDCLIRAIRPKNREQLTAYGVKGAWHAFGVPLMLSVDNGSDFHSRALRAALLELGIECQYLPRKAPWFKGSVERAIQNFERQGTGLMPGAVLTPHERRLLGLDKDPKLDPSKLAVLDLEQLNVILHRWVVDQYLNSPKAALRDRSPAQAWDAVATPDRLLLPNDVDRLGMLCTLRTSRVITATGLSVCGVQTFNSPELQKVRRDRGEIGVEVSVRYSPRRLNVIWFQHPSTHEWFEVLNSDSETSDLSEREIRMIRAHQKISNRDTDRQITFAESRKELSQWARDMKTAKTQAKRRLVFGLTGLDADMSLESDAEDQAPHDEEAMQAAMPKTKTGTKKKSSGRGNEERPQAIPSSRKSSLTARISPPAKPARPVAQPPIHDFDEFDQAPTLNRIPS